ncbi:SIR2 family protein [Subtercola frigoramans]|uniref:SIR2 family protein n=1 Tax=Subtercola frigoramans TaxID=120298 RepID=A0ABS2L7R2_9MICO|nr:SIR2 family protein [Subtercola frigoramans]MBM7473138.1 hypothetical protein [Subtercola frigoramans]
MLTFDPVREIAKLRDHLASGDKLISFLFGAGTSGAVVGLDGAPLIPLVAGLTSGCEAAVRAQGEKFAQAWESISQGLPPAKQTIEDFLSFVRQMQGAILEGDTLAGLDKHEIAQLEKVIRTTISRLVRPAAERYPRNLPHHSFARWIQRIDRLHAVELFTTNYDTLFERALEDERVPTFDGFAGAFQPFFYPAGLRFDSPSGTSDWTKIWKVHGSVTWASREVGESGSSIVRGQEIESGEMILPSVLKYDESRKQPYVAMLDRLRDVLDKREDGVLVSAGYSFGDQHINEIVFEALRNNPRLHLFALCFDDVSPESALYATAKSSSNVLVFGPTMAIIGGRTGSWKPHDVVELELRLHGLFELPEATDGAPRDLENGRLLIGDFVKFCALLDQLAGQE